MAEAVARLRGLAPAGAENVQAILGMQENTRHGGCFPALAGL